MIGKRRIHCHQCEQEFEPPADDLDVMLCSHCGATIVTGVGRETPTELMATRPVDVASSPDGKYLVRFGQRKALAWFAASLTRATAE